MRIPDTWKNARVTMAIAVATVTIWVFLALSQLEPWAQYHGAFVPARFGGLVPPGLVPFWLSPLSAALLHAGAVHLAFNLLMLVFCGRPVEAVLGPVSLAILYVLGAYAAAVAQFAIDPQSALPMIGASGAISAVVGAYAMLFGRNKVKVANATLSLWLNALWLLAAWIVLNVMVGLIVYRAANLSVAVGAHIGGFVLGLLLARPLLLFRYRRA